ncbi:MAG: SEC-C metal-binding domain-containing protein [archaeon]
MNSETTNQYGLSRYIPSDVRRQIRKECGFGCVLCGSAVYEYEHISPEFHEAKIHDPANIALLCSACHANVTRRIWSKEKVFEARQNPYCLKHRESVFNFDISKDSEYVIKIGHTLFANLESIIEIDDRVILSVKPPEADGAPFRISAMFFDRNNNCIALIEDNEWHGQVDAFDIETQGTTWKVRSALNNIDLCLRLEAPNCIVVEKINLLYNGKRISGKEGDAFYFETDKSSVILPDDNKKVTKAPFWTWVKGSLIYVGTDNIVKFTDLKGRQELLSGYYIIDGVKAQIKDQNGIDISQNVPATDKITFTSAEPNSGLGFHFELPNSDSNQIQLTAPKEARDRNSPCPCGSTKKYKYCCDKNYQKLKKILTRGKIQEILFYLQNKQVPVSYKFLFDLPEKLHTSINNVGVILVINSRMDFTEIDIARSLISAKKINEGYHLIDVKLFEDSRQQIINRLYQYILEISVTDELRRTRYDLSLETFEFLHNIRDILLKNSHLQDDAGQIHYGSVEYINFNYKTYISSLFERYNIEQLFDKNAIRSKSLGLEMIQLINESNPYTPDGYKLAIYKCAKLLDSNLPGNMYEPFIKYLEERM